MKREERNENIKIWSMIIMNIITMITYGIFIYTVDVISNYSIAIKILSFIGTIFVLLIIDYLYATSRFNKMKDYL